MTAEETFERVVATLSAEPGVMLGKAFHNPGLKIGTKLFAMLHPGGLVVKLPEDRCRELLASGAAGPFDRGQGTPMREWVTVGQPDPRRWTSYAREALSFGRELVA
ncbi:MAG: hypothetical protein QOH16_377 [Gaiellaceae bacterium]|jgi:hypothetical protein|nr:hypothetical protein [Gaiellaceae bacterium]